MPRKSTKSLKSVTEPMTEPVLTQSKLMSAMKGEGGAKKMKGGASSRKPSAYSLFVKDNYEKARHLPTKERFKHIAKLWSESKKM